MAPPRASRPRQRPTGLARALALTSVAVVVLPGCLRGDALRLATIAAVVAVKTVELVAASSRHEGRGKSTGSGVGRAGGPCGVCPEPDNGYAVCFVSTCEIRCIDGYALVDDRCEPASHSGWRAPDG
ncbi:MAG: hypothetical protein IPF92_25425 [Myxococcales bacterium]|nr:hypothetical protein [Myxococcales bacterium]